MKLNRDDRQRIFAGALERWGFVKPYGGSASTDVLHQAFVLMKSELDRLGADDDDQRAFIRAIERAVDDTSERVKIGGVSRDRAAKLQAELAAVRDILVSTFRGLPPPVTPVQSVECNFLSNVQFDE